MPSERYLQALSCERPEVIPHHVFLLHTDFISHVAGMDYHERPMTASLRFQERFDVDEGGPTHPDYTPLERPDTGKTADGGSRSEEGFGTVWHNASPFTGPEDLWRFDPDPFGKDAHKAVEPKWATRNFQWCFQPETWEARRNEEDALWAKKEDLFPGRFTPCVGFYCTTFMWGICIFGWDVLLTALGEDPDRTGEALQRISVITEKVYEYYATQSSTYFVWPHDDLCISSGPVTSPAWYRKYIYPQYEKILAPVKAAGKKVMFTSDGDIRPLARDLAPLVDGLCFESSTPAEFMYENFGQDKCLMGGINVQRLTFGTPDDVENEVRTAVERGRDCPGFILCCADSLPGNIPIENMYRYFEAVERYRRRP